MPVLHLIVSFFMRVTRCSTTDPPLSSLRPELSLKAKPAPVAAPKKASFSFPSFPSFDGFGKDESAAPPAKKAIVAKKAAPKVVAAPKKSYEYIPTPRTRAPNDFSTIEAARGPRTRPADVPEKPFDLPVFLDKARSYWN